MNEVTIGQAFETFILAKKSENVVKGTLYLYNWTMEKWLERWPDISLQAIRPEHVRGFMVWLQEQGIKGATVSIHHRHMRAFLRWCEAEDMIAGGALKNVKGPKTQEVIPDVLSEFEAVDLLLGLKNSGKASAFRDYTVHLFFLVTGIRLAELYALNLDDVNIAGGYALVKTGKGRKQRILPLGDVLPVEVKRYVLKHRKAPGDQPALFTNDEGRRLGYLWIQKTVTKALEDYVPRKLQRTGPHTLRHTACTFMLRRLKDIKTVATIMGHSNLETTERYTHLSFDDLRGVSVPTLEDLLKAKPRRGRPALLLEGPSNS